MRVVAAAPALPCCWQDTAALSAPQGRRAQQQALPACGAGAVHRQVVSRQLLHI